MPAQPRLSLADQLERVTPLLDTLTQQARLGEPALSAAEYHELEALAQEIARDVVAPFRGAGARPVHAPRYVSPDGMKAAW